MPDVSENESVFAESWDWSTQGDEWSAWMGGTPKMWADVLQPRLAPYLPAGTILEIAPGYGRIAQYLKDACDRLILVDLAENCIDACRRRFADAGNIEYHVNDGRSLDMIPDGSIDLIVSWDSLVHVEMDVLGGYLAQFPRILKPEGAAWLHHSNVATLRAARRLSMTVPDRVRRPLVDRGVLLDVYAWRASSVSAAKVARFCDEHGLMCESQELITWEHGPYLTDAISVIRHGLHTYPPLAPAVVRNRGFQATYRR